jgi:hypothetical protein
VVRLCCYQKHESDLGAGVRISHLVSAQIQYSAEHILRYRLNEERRHTIADPRPFIHETAINLERSREVGHQQRQPPQNIVLNWLEEPKQLVPTKWFYSLDSY